MPEEESGKDLPFPPEGPWDLQVPPQHSEWALQAPSSYSLTSPHPERDTGDGHHLVGWEQECGGMGCTAERSGDLGKSLPCRVPLPAQTQEPEHFLP